MYATQTEGPGIRTEQLGGNIHLLHINYTRICPFKWIHQHDVNFSVGIKGLQSRLLVLVQGRPSLWDYLFGQVVPIYTLRQKKWQQVIFTSSVNVTWQMIWIVWKQLIQGQLQIVHLDMFINCLITAPTACHSPTIRMYRSPGGPTKGNKGLWELCSYWFSRTTKIIN